MEKDALFPLNRAQIDQVVLDQTYQFSVNLHSRIDQWPLAHVPSILIGQCGHSTPVARTLRSHQLGVLRDQTIVVY